MIKNFSERTLIFPCGCGGNHVRWLLFLDAKCKNSYGGNSIEEKFNFIKENVYRSERTWYNWLAVEWSYRTDIDNFINCVHENYAWEENPNKELYLVYKDHDLPLKHYYHINLGLNSANPQQTKINSNKWLEEIKILSNNIDNFKNKKIVFADSIFNKVLPEELYEEIIYFFELDNHYEYAKMVHDVYYECRKRSAREFYEYFVNGNEFKEYAESLRKFGYEE